MEQKGPSFGRSLLIPSVQELVKKPLTDVPHRYIQPDLEPPVIPCLPSNTHQVPIIDMERLSSEDDSIYHNELQKLHHACKDWGFFQMINHGVSSSLLDKLKEDIQEFFNMPLEEKKKFWQTEEDFEGFGQAFVFSEEQKLEWADLFYMITLPHNIRKPHLFPKLPLPFRDTLEVYSREVKNTALKTLFHIAKALKMETKDMMVLFEDGMQSMRMNYYPPCPKPDQVIGLTPHSDAVGITFLLQINEVEGLQIKKDGIWIPIKPLPNAFIANIGDILEIVTNGEYKSIEHRAVVNSENERLSIATFVNPNLDAKIGPTPSLVTSETPAKFTKVALVDYLKNLFSNKVKGKSNIEQYYI